MAGQELLDADEAATLPDLARRYFEASIVAGSPLVLAARFEMRGRIKVGRWLPFRAREELAPHRGFVWAARAAGVITGSDRYAHGEAVMDWKLGGVLTVMHAEGPDVSRSTAGRVAAESVWLPGSLLPRFGVSWEADGEHGLVASYRMDGVPVELHLDLDDRALIRSLWFERWGDPDSTGSWGWHRFGGDFSAHRTFGSVTVPSAGRLGWHVGTPRWRDGEFFRYELTGMEPLGTPAR